MGQQVVGQAIEKEALKVEEGVEGFWREGDTLLYLEVDGVRHEHLGAAAAADHTCLFHGLRQDAQGVVQRPLCGVAVKVTCGAVRRGRQTGGRSGGATLVVAGSDVWQAKARA